MEMQDMLQTTEHPNQQLREQSASTRNIPTSSATMMVGGSWEQSGKAGLDLVFCDETGQLIRAHGKAINTNDPLEAEGLAMLQGLEHMLVNAVEHSERKFILFSNCKTLVKALLAGCTNSFSVHTYIPAYQERGAVAPHSLANWVCSTDGYFAGIPSDGFMKSLGMRTSIDQDFFTIP